MVQAVSAIKALRAALAAGPTPVPWEVYEPTERYPGIEATKAFQSVVIYGIADEQCGIRGKTQSEALANAAYIAAACNAAPELLAEVDRLTAERDALRAALKDVRESEVIAALTASEVQAEPVAWVGPVFQLMPHVIYEAWSARYPDDAAHFKPLVYATAPEQPAPALAFAPRVPQGWQIEQLPSGEIAMHAQGIGSCVVAPAETQPRIIPTEMLYALAKALLAAAPQPEGDTP